MHAVSFKGTCTGGGGADERMCEGGAGGRGVAGGGVRGVRGGRLGFCLFLSGEGEVGWLVGGWWVWGGGMGGRGVRAVGGVEGRRGRGAAV